MEIEVKEKFQFFTSEFEKLKSKEDRAKLKLEIENYAQTLSKDDRALYAKLVKENLSQRLNNVKLGLYEYKRTQEREGYLTYHGKQYSLAEWVPISTYVALHNLSTTNLISVWIERGVIPPSNVITIPELNNIKLIKNQVYRSK
jgi:hypothetical protein